MSQPVITLYVTPGCPQCEAARTLLVERGAVFTEIDVTADPDGLRDLLHLAGEAIVPAVVVGVDVQVGFDRERLEEMLASPLPPLDDRSALRSVLDQKTAPKVLGLEDDDDDNDLLPGPAGEVLDAAKVGEERPNASGGTGVEKEQDGDLGRWGAKD